MATGRTDTSKHNNQNDCGFCKCCTVFGAWSGLQCCCCHYSSDEAFLSIKEERFCTDIPCFCGFIFFLLIQLGIVILAATSPQSEPNRLLYFTDFNGEFCSPHTQYFDFSNNITVSGNYATWPDLRMLHIRICVDKCSDTLTDDRIVTPSFGSDLINVDIDPIAGIAVDLSGYQSALLGWSCIPNPSNVSQFISAQLYIMYQDFQRGTGLGAADAWSVMIHDFFEVWPVYIACAGIAAVLAVLWGYSIMRCGRLIVWLSFLGMLFGIAGLASALLVLSFPARDYGYYNVADVLYWTGIIMYILDVMLCFAICFMYNRIMLAIELVKETYRALNTIFTMFFYPMVPLIFFGGFFVYWMFGSAFICAITTSEQFPMPDAYKIPYYPGGATLQSKLNLPDDATYTELGFDRENWRIALYFHFFILLWVIAFIGYHSYMVIAGVYAEWYFADWADNNEQKKIRGSVNQVLTKEVDPTTDITVKLSSSPVWNSFKRVTRYHLGTIAFASLTIATIRMIEYALVYIEKKFKNVTECPLKNVTLRCVQCLMKCVKCIVNRINKDGLIISSIYGWPFCASSVKGLTIIVRNVLRAAVLSWVSGYLEWLGKLGIVFANTALCVGIAKAGFDVQILLLTAFICLIITYCVVWIYLEVYEVGIRVIFICFLIDEERNKSIHKMKASKRLRRIIGATKVPKQHISDTVTSGLHADLISNEQRSRYTVQHTYEQIGYDDIELGERQQRIVADDDSS